MKESNHHRHLLGKKHKLKEADCYFHQTEIITKATKGIYCIKIYTGMTETFEFRNSINELKKRWVTAENLIISLEHLE